MKRRFVSRGNQKKQGGEGKKIRSAEIKNIRRAEIKLTGY
jgi:hypothetical protein